MPRKGPAPKRPVVNDPVYGAPIVSQLVNKILVDGKKSHRRVDRLRRPQGRRGEDRPGPRRHAQEGARQRRPTLEVKSRRVGGATYQVPVEVKPRRATTLALRWLVSYSRRAARRP